MELRSTSIFQANERYPFPNCLAAMIPALSFRIKLLLAMVLMVVGVTGATLYISQQKFQENYRRLFTKRFESENKSFLRNQALLVEGIKESSKILVKSTRLQLALGEAAGSEDASHLFEQALTELETRHLLALGPTDTNSFLATFFLFLDAQGKILAPPAKALPNLKRFDSQIRLKQQLEPVGHALGQMDEPIAGFVTPESDSGKFELHQIVLTKMIDKPTDETLGALALGFRMPDLGESDLNTNELKVGLLFDGRIYSRSIPDSVQDELVRKFASQIAAPKQERENFMLRVDNVPHMIFYQALNPDPHFGKTYLVALFSLQELLTDQRDLRAKIVSFGVLGMAGALLLSLLLSHGFSGPIEDLVKGTTEIQRGNFGVKVRVRSRDEIGRLTASFNSMADGLAERERFRNFLNLVADKAVAEELVAGKIALGGETREISVLFCDIRGFTALTQGMDPAEVIRMLNEHFTPLTRVVYEHKGFVDKFVGDLIMAVFGAPKGYGNDTLNAARCALDMIHERERLNATSKYQIKIGIGVASGSAVAGNMGSSDRQNYTVLGERVNLASRLCGKAGRMDVVIDETTCQRLKDLVVAEPLPELELKGFSNRVQAYKLIEIRPHPVEI